MKSGVISYELAKDAAAGSEMDMLGGMNLSIAFDDKMQKMDMNMMGGLIRVQTIFSIESVKDGVLLMDMMGQKIQIVELTEEELAKSNTFMVAEGAEVKYDEKDTKEIAGYKCYRAIMKTEDGNEIKYYITDKIRPPASPKKSKDMVGLKGFPLEMTIDAQGFVMTFSAKEVSEKVSDDLFITPEGYTKMTMAEFEKQMGGMNFGLGK
jgi:hypothetical protein